ncbi:hypothetical protein JCM11641_004556 [Rhodosporidiobolus odoratus]
MASPQPHQELSLGQLLSRSLRNADQISSAHNPNDTPTQTLLTSTLSDLTLSSKLINHLGVLSPNETLEDISTRDLRCLLVEAVQGQLCVLAKTKGGEDRLKWLKKAKEHFTQYLRQLQQYEVIPPAQRDALAGPKAGETDPHRRRAGKIAQFKMEKEIKGTLEELRRRRRQSRIRSTVPSAAASTSSPHAPSSSSESTAPVGDDNDFLSDSDSETEDIARPLLINLLTLHALRAHAELGSLEQEVELLEHGMKMSEIPSPSPHTTRSGLEGGGQDGDEGADSREKGKEDDEDLWRLERLSINDGPMLSPSGKVLRPFTILPSASSASSPLATRLRLQSEVFRDSHRLPTMTIDEYLAIEEERGNVLQGGGPSSSREVEEVEGDERAAEEDDTVKGWEEEEKRVMKQREWDEYTDVHRKGEGNIARNEMQELSTPTSAARRLSTNTISPSTISVVVGETTFKLTLSQLNTDAPNYFTSALELELEREEPAASTLYLPDRDPRLFTFIVSHLSGYDILPLPTNPAALPPTMSPEATLRNLLRDAQSLQLDKLYLELIQKLNFPLQVDDLRSGLLTLEVGREAIRSGWYPVVIKGTQEEALIRLKDVALGLTPEESGSLQLTLYGTDLSLHLPGTPPKPLLCTIPPPLLSTTGINLSDFGPIPAYILYDALTGDLSEADELNFAPGLVRRIDTSRPSPSGVPGVPNVHTYIGEEVVLRVRMKSGRSSNTTPRRPLGNESAASYDLVFVSCRLNTPDRFVYDFSKTK